MLKSILIALVACCATITTIPAHADCTKESKPIFSCLTGKGKRIEVCDSRKTISYSFGKPKAKPEIVVAVPRNAASTTQHHRGSNMHFTVSVPNGDTTYSVFWGVDDAASESSPIEAGVYVEINNKHVATVACVKDIYHDMEGIDLKESE